MTIGLLFTAEYTGKIEKDLLKKAFYDIVFFIVIHSKNVS